MSPAQPGLVLNYLENNPYTFVVLIMWPILSEKEMHSGLPHVGVDSRSLLMEFVKTLGKMVQLLLSWKINTEKGVSCIVCIIHVHKVWRSCEAASRHKVFLSLTKVTLLCFNQSDFAWWLCTCGDVGMSKSCTEIKVEALLRLLVSEHWKCTSVRNCNSPTTLISKIQNELLRKIESPCRSWTQYRGNRRQSLNQTHYSLWCQTIRFHRCYMSSRGAPLLFLNGKLEHMGTCLRKRNIHEVYELLSIVWVLVFRFLSMPSSVSFELSDVVCYFISK